MGLEMEYQQSVNSCDIQITNKCNFSCAHCYQRRGSDEMSFDGYAQVLDWLKGSKVRNVTIFGGEVRLHRDLKRFVEETNNRGLVPTIYTNGFGMKDPESTTKIINEIAAMGVKELVISTDHPHREYAKKAGFEIDYGYLNELCTYGTMYDRKINYGINPDIDIFRAGAGEYVIPVGRAKNFSWEDRFEDGKGNKFIDYLLINATYLIQEEYQNWGNTGRFSHQCYCSPTKFIREAGEKSAKGYRHIWFPYVNTDRTVTLCPLDILPRIGSIDKMSLPEVYAKATSNLLYNIISWGGPQSIARRLWSISEKDLKERFIERTPCGMCEDMASSNFNDLQKMMDDTINR